MDEGMATREGTYLPRVGTVVLYRDSGGLDQLALILADRTDPANVVDVKADLLILAVPSSSILKTVTGRRASGVVFRSTPVADSWRWAVR